MEIERRYVGPCSQLTIGWATRVDEGAQVTGVGRFTGSIGLCDDGRVYADDAKALGRLEVAEWREAMEEGDGGRESRRSRDGSTKDNPWG